MVNQHPIDIVITWVDGNDSSWRNRYEQYLTDKHEGDKRLIRFRDWGLLRYWFRGIEKYAQWVNKIHFVTSGERPDWLDIDHPRLNWVRHEDFIPSQFLPTFNINTIETNLHRIDGLSEHFVFFNDDMFLLNHTKREDFFRNGLPCDFAILDPIFPEEYPEIFVNNTMLINRHFKKKEVIKNNLTKWINLRYGKYLTKTLLLLTWEKFTGVLEAHLAHAYRKTIFDEVWQAEPNVLENTGLSRFRNHTNVNQWLFRFWHLAKGEFAPINVLSQGQSFEICDKTINHICDVIISRKYMQICINDGEQIGDFDASYQKLQQAFGNILPDKSTFERP